MDRFDFDFRLGLLVFLGGLWVFFLQEVMRITGTHGFSHITAVLGFLHYVLLVYLCLALYSFYGAGLEALHKEGKDLPGLSTTDSILFGTWPVAVVGILPSWIAAKLELHGAFIVLSPLIVLLLYVLLIWGTGIGKALSKDKIKLGGFILGSGLLFFLYLQVSSNLLAGVVVETDKAFYEADDPIGVHVEPTGYVFRPDISGIRCGHFKSVGFESASLIPAEEHLGRSIIEVEFFPSGLWRPKLTHTHRLRILSP